MTSLSDPRATASECASDAAIADLLRRASTLRDALVAAPAADTQTVVDRLTNSVVRPLEAALGLLPADQPAPASSDEPANSLDDAIWRLAEAATHLRTRPDMPMRVQEATAALQDLTCVLADPGVLPERLAALRAIQTNLPASIQSQTNGPYLVTNVERLVDWLGVSLASRPQMALCRCGQSPLRPLCDGSHARIGFSDAKDPRRVPDRRDTYPGEEVTILDNRGICQHAGFCTDRLASVFHAGEEPFVTPSGGRLDEIIRAVRDCPSGALSFAMDGHEEREQVDYHATREPSIEVSRDGPYRVTGGIPLLDDEGANEARNQGASREHYALCRCGQSRNKPFCSGMHYSMQFRDPVAPPDHTPSLFEWAGGLPALTRMTRIFYEKYVPQEPLLAPLFSQMASDHPQRVAAWLAEVFGGPKAYSSAYGGYPRMLSQHLGKGLTEERRGRWVALISQSAQDAGLPSDPEFRSAFGAYIEWGSRLALENSQPGARPPEHMPMPRWDWNTAAGPPGSRVSALRPPEDAPQPAVAVPGADETVSFESHIQGLFRPMDRNTMRFAFDLWSLDEVRLHARAILERLRAGSMPCDGAWPEAQIDVFRRWTESGMAA